MHPQNVSAANLHHPVAESDLHAVFPGPGEMAAVCRALDWSATPLGSVSEWPPSLRTTVALVLATNIPSVLLWGPDLVQIYNDAYVPFLGVKHPAGLGIPSRTCWPEVWALVEPVVIRVFAGEAVTLADQHYPLLRRGAGAPPDDVYISLSCVPVRGESGEVGGILVSAVDTSAQVRARRADLERTQWGERYQAERARVLEEVFRASPSFLHVLHGPDFVFELVSDAYYQLVGYRDLLGRPAFEAMPEAAEDGYQEIIRHVLATREPFYGRELAVTLARTPGALPEQRLIDLTYIPLLEPDGSCTRVLGHGIDVTEHVRARRRAEQSLEWERQGVAAMLEASNAVMAVCSGPEHVLTRVSPSWTRLVGKPDAVGRTVRDVFPETLSTRLWEQLDRVYESGIPFMATEMPLPLQRLPGGPIEETLWSFLWTPFPGAYPVGPSGLGGDLLLHAVDVTALVRAREAIEAARAEADAARARAERERLRTAEILESMADAHATLDCELRFVAVNRAAERALARSREQIIGRTQSDVFPALGQREVVRACRRVLAEGSEVHLVEHFVGDTHDDLYLEIDVYPADGDEVAIFWRDVTERVRAEQFQREMSGHLADHNALLAQYAEERERLLAAEHAARARAEAATASAEAANRAKSEFLAVMSHELRTPLNAIGGYAELIEMGIRGPVTEEQRRDLARIQQSQRHLLGLINGVLNFAKVEGGHVSYDVSDVPVGEVVAAAEALVAPQARAKGLTLRFDECPSTVRARADREKVQQVILNLVSNAVKFTGRGGTVAVTCEIMGPIVAVRIADTGIGIDAGERERVFQPFVQVDARLTRTHEGTGLGLSISRDLARGMGGDLTLESELGIGSTFTLTLPLATA